MVARKTTDLGTATSLAAGDYFMVVRPGETLAVDRNKKILVSHLRRQNTVSSDADFTVTAFSDAEEVKHDGTLTADRTITLSTTDAYSGARFRISRTVSSSSYVLHVGALCDLAAKSWCEVIYDGSAWYVAAAGNLPA